MRSIGLSTAIVAAVISLAEPRLVAAEPVVITTGTITAEHPLFGGADFSIAGDSFSLSGFFSEGGSGICFPCTPGSQSIRLIWGGDMGSGSGTVNGTAYPNLYFAGTGFSVGGNVAFPPDGPTMFTVTFPFSVGPGSVIWGFPDPARNNRVFMLDVSGSGTATMTVTRPPFTPVLYSTRALSFEFAGNAAPTPEPASLLLLATGVAAVAARSRSRLPRP